MAWWVRRDQWPHMELGPFADRAEAEALHVQLTPEALAGVGGARWSWSVVPGDWFGSHVQKNSG
jgi:hypothetical protein